MDITARFLFSSVYTGNQPSGHWHTSASSIFNKKGTLGPHKSISRTPTYRKIKDITKYTYIITYI